jgi:hypothetical protein
MSEQYLGNCVTHACRIAELLFAEERSPWIGRLRIVTTHGDHVRHWPLIPSRFRGPAAVAWNTHYVAGAGRQLYDPILGTAIDLDAYASAVFAQPLSVATHFDPARTAQLLRSGGLRDTFRPRA